MLKIIKKTKNKYIVLSLLCLFINSCAPKQPQEGNSTQTQAEQTFGQVLAGSSQDNQDPITLGFDDMYVDDSLEFSDTLQDAAGKTVYFRGYAAKPLEVDANYFVLTRYPMAVCPFCETEAEWPNDIVYIKLPPKGTDTILFGGLGVTGRLEVGAAKDPDNGFVSRVRIFADSVDRAN